MMKIIGGVILFLISGFLINFNANAVSWNGSPESIMNSVESAARPGKDTKMDTVSGGGIYRTLNSIKNRTIPYIRWMVYVGLSLAVIFVIYNGLLMTLTPLTNEGYTKVRKRVLYMTFGIIGLTGFTLIIRIVLSIVANISG